MKKRWAAGVLCILLLFQLSAPVRAARSVYFVAAEESVLPLTDTAMPFWSNGYLYVAASVFTSLGVSVINNTAKSMTVLEKDRRALLFDWKRGIAQDSSGTIYTPGTIRSGRRDLCPRLYGARLLRPAILRHGGGQRPSGMAAVSGLRHERPGVRQRRHI